MLRKEKKNHTPKLRSTVRMNLVSMKFAKKGREVCVSFSVAFQIAKVMATVHDKCLVKMEKTLHLWVEDMET